MEGRKILVEFNSNWQEGTVTTEAQLNLATGAVTDIAVSEEGAKFEHLLSETIEAGGLGATVEADDEGNYFVADQGELAAFRGWVADVEYRRASASGFLTEAAATAARISYERMRSSGL